MTVENLKKALAASTRSGRRTVPVVPGVLRYASPHLVGA